MKSFLCVIDNVISFVPVNHSTRGINKYVIDWSILTISCRQSFQKAFLKNKTIGNRNDIRMGQRVFDWKVTIHIIVYITRQSLWESNSDSLTSLYAEVCSPITSAKTRIRKLWKNRIQKKAWTRSGNSHLKARCLTFHLLQQEMIRSNYFI